MRLVRDLLSRAAMPVRRFRGRRSAARVPAERRTAGWVDVVVAARDVGAYVDACLESVLAQGHWRLNVHVVDDGSTDETAARLERWRRRDSRVLVRRVEVGDPNAARNLAIASCSAEFLTFLDADDVLLAGAYRDLVGALRESGSDFAVGSYDRLEGGRRTPAAFWIDDAHATPARRATVTGRPDVMVNVVQWARMYRRDFWDRAGLSFPEGGHFQDQLVSARAYARAEAFDILTRPIVSWRIRSDGSSMTQQTVSARQVADRFRTLVEAVAILDREAGAGVAAERLRQALSNDAAIAASRLADMDADAATELRDGLRSLSVPIGDPVWDDVPAASKVLFELILRGDADRAREYLARGGLDLLRHPIGTRDGTVVIELPFFGDAAAGIPVARFVAAPRDLRALSLAGRLGADPRA